MTQLPASFLARTAHYPARVRAALGRRLAPEDVSLHLTALHGASDIPEARLRDLLDDPPLVDAFLGRLLQSQLFATRAAALEATLDDPAPLSGGAAALALAEAEALLAPLTDPARPYLWKLRDMAEQDAGGKPGRLTPERASALLDLSALLRLAEGAGTAAEVLARALLDPAPLPLAAWSAAVLGETAARAGTPADPGPRAVALARLIVQGRGLLPLRAADRTAWAALPRDADGALEAGRPREIRLEVAPGVALSPILEAGLRVTALGAGPRALIGPDPEDGPSWAAELTGHPDPRPASEIAWLDGPGASLPPLPVATRRARPVPPGDADPASAYAIVLRLDPDAPIGTWLNLDQAHVLPGHGAAALTAAKALDAPATRPVVLASRLSPADPDHMTRAVARHWAHAGRYPVSGAMLDYDPATGRFELDAHARTQPTRLLPAALTSLPLGMLETAGLHGPLVTLAEGIGVAMPTLLPAATRAGLARALAPERLDGPARAAILEAGPVTRALLTRLDGARHWPVEHLLAARAARHDALAARLDAFADRPEAEAVPALLADLAAPEADPIGLEAPTGRFLTALAAEGALLAALPEDLLLDALERARHHPEADRIARALAVTGPEMVGDRPFLIEPLTDLWAVGLPEPALQAAWAALAEAQLAADPETPGRLILLAASGRRHAGAAALARLAARLAQVAPEALADPRLARHFRALPDHPDWPLMARALGPAAAAIAAARDPRDRFAAALAAGDRDAAQTALAELHLLNEGELAGWLDGLRGLSNELAALDLDIAGHVPPGGGVQRRKLMAALLRDRAELSRLAADGLLADETELSALCLQLIGRPETLEARLAPAWPAAPLRLRGATAAEVFGQAATGPTLPGHAGTRVSVVIGAYEPDPEMLALSLASLRAQGHDDLEIFLIDDASGPEGRATIDAACAADPELILIRMARNAGPYAGRNAALQRATGAFFAIQDADDWSHPDRFAAQLDAFAADPELALVTTPHIRIDAQGEVQMEARFAVQGDGPMTSMFRRDVFDRIGPFAPTRSRGDVELRERLRGALGGHTMREIPGPPMLCYAAATTLSQRVRAERREALQLLRGHIDRRPAAWGAVRDGDATVRAVIPHALRSEDAP
ncbi:glycosyltransferase family A protein [Jannaschia seohaensis]|uniref:Glycosyl transferase family 2 n=1 Tax=Jannaschia seohaensis TaxID=475081 RepID=A0A2Y9C320_9RHOB|nr:glycosyltransferase family A protein [Jannaschia seohaensis]PWJ12904.1 glycosyl transferase family 2 [Jannaschia seohaensis]SSA50712.1 Glycosyl transferase family 2 [Jannaschia seohaensis]